MPTIGKMVRIRPHWQDSGDDKLTVIIASLDNYPRIVLQVLEQSGMPIQPTYTVTENMIQDIGE